MDSKTDPRFPYSKDVSRREKHGSIRKHLDPVRGSRDLKSAMKSCEILTRSMKKRRNMDVCRLEIAELIGREIEIIRLVQDIEIDRMQKESLGSDKRQWRSGDGEGRLGGRKRAFHLT